MRNLSDEQIEAKIRENAAERKALLADVQPLVAELDRRVALERWAQAYAEADEHAAAEILERVGEDADEVVRRSGKWAGHAQTLGAVALEPLPEIPARSLAPAPRRWWQ